MVAEAGRDFRGNGAENTQPKGGMLVNKPSRKGGMVVNINRNHAADAGEQCDGADDATNCSGRCDPAYMCG